MVRSQPIIANSPESVQIIEVGLGGDQSPDTMTTERSIRTCCDGHRRVMGSWRTDQAFKFQGQRGGANPAGALTAAVHVRPRTASGFRRAGSPAGPPA